MNLCVVLCQGIVFAVFIMQYQYKVEAEKPSIPANNWFNSLEKKINVIQDVINDVFQNVRKKAKDYFPPPVRPLRQSDDATLSISLKEDHEDSINGAFDDKKKELFSENFNLYETFKSQEIAEATKMNTFKSYNDTSDNRSDVSNDESPHYPYIRKEVTEETYPIKKKRIKKTKKKNHKLKPKRTRIEKYAEFSPVYKKHHKQPVRRNFVKTTVNQSNFSDSGEVTKKGKPVDIIVHIKMNEKR